MISDDELGHTVSYWPSVSDLFMTLFVVAIALVGAVVLVALPVTPDKGPIHPNQCQEELRKAYAKIEDLEGQIRNLREELKTSQAKIEDLEGQIHDIQEELKKAHAKIETLEGQVWNFQEKLEHAQAKIKDLTGKVLYLQEELEHAHAKIKDLERRVHNLGDKPPIITIAASDKHHFFSSGSATLTPDFKTDLAAGGFQKIAVEILKRNRDGRQAVDTLEIIGHTDGVPIARRGNLDEVLPDLLDGDSRGFERLSPGSNNDLGLLRALAIKHAWSEFVAQHPENEQLRPIAVRTYSAGQTLPVNAGGYRAADASSRRIELRLTKLLEESAPVPGS